MSDKDNNNTGKGIEQNQINTTISANLKDSVGVIIGSNIKVGDINVNVTNVIQEIKDYGLKLLHPNHFIDNSDTSENVEKWKKGFPLYLESIYQHKEYKRERVLQEIREKLEEKKRLLLLGESGTSKTTILMEIICQYFNNGYRVLYNLDDDELKDINKITEKIKDLANGDNRILIVIDNVHSQKMSLIFNTISDIQPFNSDKKDRIRFLLAARQPEFNWILERNLFDNTTIVQRIEELFDDDYKYIVPYFTKDETQDFIKKYIGLLDISKRQKPIEQIAEEIYNDTKGYPILVRFSVLNQGLRLHVKQMYEEYILEKTKINLDKLKIMIINSLFDISTISLKESTSNELGLLNELGLEDIAYDMDDTIIKKEEGVWRTIHHKWDLEFFRYIFSLKNSRDSRDIIKCFSIINDVFKSQKITMTDKLFLANTIYYTLIKEKITDFKTIENTVLISIMEKELDKDKRSMLLFLVTIIGFSYYESGRDHDAIEFYEKALKIDPNYIYAYNNKGLSLSRLDRDTEAIAEYDKALERDPNALKAYYNKGLSLSRLDRDTEAIAEYDKVLEIDPNYIYAYYKKGLSLSRLDRDTEAIAEYDKVLEIDKNFIEAYLAKTSSLLLIKRTDEAKYLVKKVLDFDPENLIALELKEIVEKEDNY